MHGRLTFCSSLVLEALLRRTFFVEPSSVCGLAWGDLPKPSLDFFKLFSVVSPDESARFRFARALLGVLTVASVGLETFCDESVRFLLGVMEGVLDSFTGTVDCFAGVTSSFDDGS